jgi:surface protein
MDYMCYNCQKINTIPQLDTSKITDMTYMFYGCSKLETIPPLDTSKVTTMNAMFQGCGSLVSLPPLDTSKVTNMNYMFQTCNSLVSVPPLNASSLTSGNIFSSSDLTKLTDFGGLIGLKCSVNGSSYSFAKLPNLTYESCINVLNGLYDFTGNGVKPTSSQAKLKIHSNFLTLVGDELSIGINKGWTITV